MIIEEKIAQYWLIGGQVQGVGFRPYIYRLATQYHLVGWVKNLAGQVEIKVQGYPHAVQNFAENLIRQAPPLAQVKIINCVSCTVESLTDFNILASETTAKPHIHVPPDYFTCQDCLTELNDPHDRRYRYPFINCTQCGPRYTLIYRLPYDRPNTSMAGFPLCPACAIEYHNPQDRRFHAQPLACPICGPQLFFREGNFIASEALTACVQALKAGKIVAVKGIGGYHLFCIAHDDETVLRLRHRKHRPDKPLAVMFPMQGEDGLAMVHTQLILEPTEALLLTSPLRPIVLVRKHHNGTLSSHIAPGLTEIGVMLPYSPLHHLLLKELDTPVIATSANISGEPVLTDEIEVEQRLTSVADAFLHHQRPILRPADDAVFKTIAHKSRPLRLGRGNTPLELPLSLQLAQPLLAVGGHLKNTIALAENDRVILSPHIGDLDSPRSLSVFTQVIADFQQLYDLHPQLIVCDAHSRYVSHQWAQQSGIPVQTVFHHYAHASAIAGEFPTLEPWLIFTWDGVGLGADHTLWGGETLYGRPGQWQRVASMKPFFLPGGEKASRELWRSALAICWEAGLDWQPPEMNHSTLELLYQAWQRRLNCPQTTAVGRLFDAASALIGVLQNASYEGQGPMLLESICNDSTAWIDLPLQPIATTDLWQVDWSPLLKDLLTKQHSVEEHASIFHNSFAHSLLTQAQHFCQRYPVGQIGFAGGVFQNRRLTEQALQLLQQHGLTVYLPEKLPCNDASLSFGQVIEIAAIIKA
ncbi:MAG: carbamoyltransferase HypF [Beggiatoa sp. IS2]|nr:MAG: carbamoyltransferase HypF [Beggiatoa sp. IS2]